jgi:NAD(P) transhydrogenase
MNRSLTNVIFGGIAPTQVADDSTKGLTVTRTDVTEVVEMLGNAETVVIVPGYGELHRTRWSMAMKPEIPSDHTGMAVAKAQYAISEMVQALRAKGIKCRFGIHPVAARPM